MFNDTMTSKCKQKEAKQAETSKSKQKQAENKQKQIGWREETLAEADGLMWCSELQEIPVESCVVLEFALASLDNIYSFLKCHTEPSRGLHVSSLRICEGEEKIWMEIFDKKVEGIRLRWTLIWGTSWAWQTRAVGIPDRLDWFHARMARWQTCQPLPVMPSKLCIQLWNVHPSSLGITHLHW